MAAGLGGGSGDAAAVLRLAAGEVDDLPGLAAELGADIVNKGDPELAKLMPLAKGGQIRAIGAGMKTRMPGMPDLPTLDELGIKGYECYTWNVILAPKGLPDDVRAILSDAIVAAVKEPELQEKMRKLGVEPVGKASAEADTFFNQELQRWKQVIDAAGIKLER